jgi:hypothetical protein
MEGLTRSLDLGLEAVGLLVIDLDLRNRCILVYYD